MSDYDGVRHLIHAATTPLTTTATSAAHPTNPTTKQKTKTKHRRTTMNLTWWWRTRCVIYCGIYECIYVLLLDVTTSRWPVILTLVIDGWSKKRNCYNCWRCRMVRPRWIPSPIFLSWNIVCGWMIPPTASRSAIEFGTTSPP